MPNKELFGQTLKLSVSLTDRLAVGVQGQVGADNILIQDLLRQFAIPIYLRLSASGVFNTGNGTILQYVVAHGAGTFKVSLSGDGDIQEETTVTDFYSLPLFLPLASGQNVTFDLTGATQVLVIYLHNPL